MHLWQAPTWLLIWLPSCSNAAGHVASQAVDRLLSGTSREELEQQVSTMFRAADKDDSGKLDASEFHACIRCSANGDGGWEHGSMHVHAHRH